MVRIRGGTFLTDAERYGWSFVFAGLLPGDFPETRAVADAPWWRQVDGACRRHPEGPGSYVADRAEHPVVHVSWNGAVAHAAWAGRRLPTEADWEYAARGGLDQHVFPWGDELEPGGEHRMNGWQGSFPDHNTLGEDPQGPPVGLNRVIRGGSCPCHASCCRRYRVSARSSNGPDSSTGNQGFRCVLDDPQAGAR